MFLANKASVQEGIKESLLAKLKEAMDLAVKTGKNINALVKWTILDVPQRVGVTWFRLGEEPRVPFHGNYHQAGKNCISDDETRDGGEYF